MLNNHMLIGTNSAAALANRVPVSTNDTLQLSFDEGHFERAGSPLTGTDISLAVDDTIANQGNFGTDFTLENGTMVNNSSNGLTDYGHCLRGGTGQLIMPDPSGAFSFDGDFTIEVYTMRINVGSNGRWLGKYDAANNKRVWSLEGGTFSNSTLFRYSTNGTSNSTWYFLNSTGSNNQWYHLAITREAGTVRMFTDGVLNNTVTGQNQVFYNTDNPVHIGSAIDGTEMHSNCFLDNVRIVAGEALYTSAFTPPASFT